MTQPPDDLQRVLARARVEHDPSAADKARVLAQLRTAWAAEAGPGVDGRGNVGGEHTTAVGRLVRWASSAAGKGTLGLVVVAALGVATWPRTAPATPTQPRVPALLADARGAPAVAAVDAPTEVVAPMTRAGLARPAPGVAPPLLPVRPVRPTSPRLTPAIAPHAERDRRVQHVAEQAESTAASTPTAPDGSTANALTTAREQAARAPSASDEIVLLRRAQFALRDGQPSRALHFLSQHAARFPDGLLREERAGLSVLSLCAAGETEEGLRQKSVFLREAPRSPLAERVRSACTADEQGR